MSDRRQVMSTLTGASLNGARATRDIDRPRPARLARGRRGRPVVWATGLLLVAGGAAAGGAAALSAGSKHAVLVMNRPVPAGRILTAADLRTTRIGADAALDVVPAADEASVLGQLTRVDLVAGSLLVRGALGGPGVPGSGQVLLGVAFKPGQLPGRPLSRGDHAELIATPAATAASQSGSPSDSTPTSTGVTVDAEQPAAADGSIVVDLVVPADAASSAAQAAAAGRLVLVLLPRDGS